MAIGMLPLFVIFAMVKLQDGSPYCSIGIDDACNRDLSCCTGFCDKDLHIMPGFGRCCQFHVRDKINDGGAEWNSYREQNNVRIERNCTCFPGTHDDERKCGGLKAFRRKEEQYSWKEPYVAVPQGLPGG
ncbi:hypothetical protein HDE_05672 [Halotydeus destructor]|nr:hypothetical protein HDE_05672 [Halotydeus destructor]